MSDTKRVSRSFKNRWHSDKDGKKLSLKAFARKLLAEGDAMAESWFSYKKGLLNQSRKPENVTRANLERQASKSARGK